MIGFLSGVVKVKTEKTLLVLVQGVGYEVLVSTDMLAHTMLGAPVELYIHTHVREDALTLYGFSSLEERAFFLTVTSVSGIGPKIGLEILSVPLAQVQNAILTKDPAFLTTIPGIGKKTAERIVLELQGKIGGFVTELPTEGTPVHTDIIHALENLGYRADAIHLALRHMPKEITQEEDIIKYCLKVL